MPPRAPWWLVPLWLPLVLGAIASGVLLAWLVPIEVPAPGPRDVRLADVTYESGVRFVHRAGADLASTPTTLGGGVVVFDFDDDGDPDLFFVDGTDWPWERTFAKRARGNACALYRNDGAGRFTDVSMQSGLNVELQGMSAAAGDFDRDGRPDLYVTGVGANHLYRNLGDGRFEDVTETAGVGGDDNVWSTGAAWVDVDGDGWLDLVVCHYARWPREVGLDGAFSVALMGRSYGTPTGFLGTPPTVYRNLGDGRFEPIPDAAGLGVRDAETGLPVGQMLAVVPGDVNDDGRPDLLFTYHADDPVIFLGVGDGSFRRWSGNAGGRQEGAALLPVSAWAVGGSDDRLRVLAEFELTTETTSPESAGVSLESRLGIALGDFDLDGRLEAFGGDGRLEAAINQIGDVRALEASPRLLWRGESGAWNSVPPAEGAAWAQPALTRAVATADLDGDGALDLVLTRFGAAPVLLRNESAVDRPWLAVELVAAPGARDPAGARVEVHTPRRVHVRTWMPAMGLFAQSSPTLLFALGEDSRVRRVVVTWPTGEREEVRIDRINQRLRLRAPAPAAERASGVEGLVVRRRS
jgi:hypothetical protein